MRALHACIYAQLSVIGLIESCTTSRIVEKNEQRYYISDVQHVRAVLVTEDRPGTGTFYYLADSSCLASDWVIYFDSSMKKIAAVSVYSNSVCTMTNYWENGKVKGVEIYRKELISHVEYYCENGTLVRSTDYSHLDLKAECYRQSDTVFYCNGNMMSAYNAVTHESTLWYENGKKALEGIEENCLNEGRWIEYDATGTPVMYRYYTHGEMTGLDSIH